MLLLPQGLPDLSFSFCSHMLPEFNVLLLLAQNLFKQLTDEEKIAAEEFRRDLSDAEKYLEGIERQYGSNLPSWLNWGPFRAIFGGGSGNYGSAR